MKQGLFMRNGMEGMSVSLMHRDIIPIDIYLFSFGTYRIALFSREKVGTGQNKF